MTTTKNIMDSSILVECTRNLRDHLYNIDGCMKPFTDILENTLPIKNIKYNPASFELIITMDEKRMKKNNMNHNVNSYYPGVLSAFMSMINSNSSRLETVMSNGKSVYDNISACPMQLISLNAILHNVLIIYF